MEKVAESLVSVVITTHNRSRLLKQAVESVLKQTYKNIEIIVVDDCSTDNTKEVVGYLYSSLKYVRHKKNEGGVASRMTGARTAQGEYIAFLDDDDQWVAEKIEKQVAVAELAGANCAVVTCGAKIFRNGEKTVYHNIPKINGNIRKGILSQGLGTIPSCHLFNKAIFDRMKGYDLDMPYHNEHDIWMKMAHMDYNTLAVKEPLVIIHEDDRARMMTNVNERIKAFKIFYSKWRENVYEWYGPKEGATFLRNYMAQKLLSNSLMLARMRNKDRRGALVFIRNSLPYLSYRNVGQLFNILTCLMLPRPVIDILLNVKNMGLLPNSEILDKNRSSET